MRTLVVFSALFLFCACKKEVNRPLSIQLGDETNMVVDYTPVNTGLNQLGIPYSIDFDQDGVNDLALFSDIHHSFIIGFSGESYIKSLHDGCAVVVDVIPDTTFVHYSTQFTQNQNNDLMAIVSTTYSCQREFPVSQVYSSGEISKPRPLQKATALNRYDEFRSGTFYLKRASVSTFESTGVFDQGYEYHDYIAYLYPCAYFPEEVYRYIGIRLNTADGTRLGWVKIAFDGESIQLNNWAIQE